MGRAPCCDKANVKRGPWSPEEDATLRSYINSHGTGNNWISLPQKAGLKRCGKSCRLRWLNYLRPDIKHGGFTADEDRIIFSLYKSIGSRWSIIASQLPGRTDNDVKNYWNTKLAKKIKAAGESIVSKPNISNTHNKLHPPCPSPPPQLQIPAIKEESFFSNSLPLVPLNSTSSSSLLSYHYQIPEDFSFTGPRFSPPPADELSASASAGSSSITMEDSGSCGIGYGAYFDDSTYFPELGFASWTDLLSGSTASGTPDTLSELWANSDGTIHGIHQSLYSS